MKAINAAVMRVVRAKFLLTVLDANNVEHSYDLRLGGQFLNSDINKFFVFITRSYHRLGYSMKYTN